MHDARLKASDVEREQSTTVHVIVAIIMVQLCPVDGRIVLTKALGEH